MAKNRYGWQKRAKELARKQKHDDKIKRRQGKALEPDVPELATETLEELPTAETMDEMPAAAAGAVLPELALTPKS